MKRSLGRRPLEMTFAFILVVTLLLPGVTSKSIASTATVSVASGLEVGDLERQPVLDEVKTEPGNGVSPDETESTGLKVPQEDRAGTGTNDENDKDDALALFSLLVKRAIDEDDGEMMNDSEEGDLENDSIDEDKFSISDLPKLLKPLIDAFSDESSSEAPQKDDFLSWFPSLKDLFEPSKPSGTETTISTTRSGRRSSFSVASQPSLQASPVSAQPPGPTILPSSQPTITRPPVTITKPQTPFSKRPITINPPEDLDSDEDSETDF